MLSDRAGGVVRFGQRIESGLGGFIALAAGMILFFGVVVTQAIVVYQGVQWHGRGIATPAVVRGDSRGIYLVPVEYDVGGRHIQADAVATAHLDFIKSRTFSPGDPVTLEYDGRYPERARLLPERSWPDVIESIGFAILLIAGGLSALRNWRRERNPDSTQGPMSPSSEGSAGEPTAQ